MLGKYLLHWLYSAFSGARSSTTLVVCCCALLDSSPLWQTAGLDCEPSLRASSQTDDPHFTKCTFRRGVWHQKSYQLPGVSLQRATQWNVKSDILAAIVNIIKPSSFLLGNSWTRRCVVTCSPQSTYDDWAGAKKCNVPHGTALNSTINQSKFICTAPFTHKIQPLTIFFFKKRCCSQWNNHDLTFADS